MHDAREQGMMSMNQLRSEFLNKAIGFSVAAAMLIWAGIGVARAAEPHGDLDPIGGRWFVKAGDKPVYFYQDDQRFVDLFSYHAKDSNKDGIDNLRLSHDRQFLIIDSQG